MANSCEDHIHSLYSVLNDTVEHYLLWFKLQIAGVRGRFMSSIKSLHSELRCTVRVNNNLTPWFDVEAGVKQGCILLPTIFSVYINDLAERMNSLNCGITIDAIRLGVQD